MGNTQVQDLAPVRTDERSELNLSRNITHKQYIKHTRGDFAESCLFDLPWSIRDSVSLYERMDVSFNRLTEIPVEIPLRLPHLSYVNLSHNQLVSLPESMGLLFHLKTLLVNNNKLKTLPSSFVHLVKLEKVDMSNNVLTELPEDLGKMESLRKLNISNNHLRTLPISLGKSDGIEVVLARHNRLENPPQHICNEGSIETIRYLQKQSSPNGVVSSVKPKINVFPRERGNQLHFSAPNPHSALVEYIQAQTNTTNTPSRIKTPLLPPLGASQLDVNDLKDRIIGLLYGAAIGDALGLATKNMKPDECQFHYEADDLTYSHIIRDELRVCFKAGDWTTHFDQLCLVLDSLVHWAGVTDELDFAKRLSTWSSEGFPELDDTEGFVVSNTITKAINDARFLQDPHTVANEMYHSIKDDAPDAYADNGAVARAILAGVPQFHKLEEVAENAERICRATHADPRCVGSTVIIACLVALILQGCHENSIPDSTDRIIRQACEVGRKYLSDPAHLKELEKYLEAQEYNEVGITEKSQMSFTFTPVGCAVAALRMEKDFKSSLTELIMLGADSTANACITGAILGCCCGYSLLPQVWVDGLQDKQVTWLNGRINLLLDMMGIP